MDEADRGLRGWTRLKAFAHARRPEAEAVLARIRAEGPMAASDFEHGRSRSGWWEWGDTKQALEFLFWAGHITTATRRGSFERVYDLAERVIPKPILAMPTPSPAEAQRRLIELAARAHGVATAADLRDYFRLKPEEAKAGDRGLGRRGHSPPRPGRRLAPARLPARRGAPSRAGSPARPCSPPSIP